MGKFVLSTAQEDAGPYFIRRGGVGPVVVGFGEKTLNVGKHGSVAQQEALRLAEVTLEVAHLVYDDPTLDQVRRAAQYARSLAKTWGSQIEKPEFQHAVFRRLEKFSDQQAPAESSVAASTGGMTAATKRKIIATLLRANKRRLAFACAHIVIGKTAVYKGRKYKLLWSGPTRYGNRAKLGFFDGSKEFWVDESRIEVVPDSSRSQKREMCDECGVRPGIVKCRDSSGLHGMCCRQCAQDPWYQRSFM
jgi:hypothetical protein